MRRSLLTVAVAAACVTDDDCSLNGLCDATVCACDAAWAGASCSRLALLPAPHDGGYRALNTSSWGGTVVHFDGAWHMIVAESLGGCGLNAYARNLRLAHAVSSSGAVAGPYVRAGDVTAPVANTAHAVRDPADGSLLLFATGCGAAAAHGCPPITECRAGATDLGADMSPGGAACAVPTECVDDDGTNVFRSASGDPAGPWELDTSPLLDTAAPRQLHADGTIAYYCNPAPLLLENGTALLMYRDYYPTQTFPATNVVGLARARRGWRGAFDFPLGVDGHVVANFTEDPHMWRDARGHFHALFHALDRWGTADAGSTVGGHAYSRDGLAWAYSREYAYSTTVAFDDGTSTTFARRERPEAVVVDGSVVALVTGVVDPDAQQPAGSQRDRSWTLVQPVVSRAPSRGGS